VCQGNLFKEPNPYAGSRPRDIIGLYRKHKTLNPNPTGQQPNSPWCSRHQVAGRRPDQPGWWGGRERDEAGAGASTYVEEARRKPTTVGARTAAGGRCGEGRGREPGKQNLRVRTGVLGEEERLGPGDGGHGVDYEFTQPGMYEEEDD
jgi:hypothetical protein